MKNLYVAFPTRSNAPDSNYPTGSAKNVVTQGDGTGTPWTSSLANDIFGFFQRCCALAGITASNNSETALTSQVHDGIRLSKGLPGEIIQHCWTTIPTGVRVLNLQGQTILISSYTELVAACYCGDGNNHNAYGFYKTSDAGGTTRDTAGTYMVLPDARGRFLRAIDPSALIDKDGGERLPGNDQGWSMATHHHWINVDEKGGVQNVGKEVPSTGVKTGGSTAVIFQEDTGSSSYPIYANETIDNEDNPGVFSGHESDNEIRPQNMAVHVGIWY